MFTIAAGNTALQSVPPAIQAIVAAQLLCLFVIGAQLDLSILVDMN